MCICTYTTSAPSEDVKEIGKKEELFFCKPAWVGSNGAVRQWRAFRLLCKPADTSSAGAARSSGCRQLPVRRRAAAAAMCLAVLLSPAGLLALPRQKFARERQKLARLGLCK